MEKQTSQIFSLSCDWSEYKSFKRLLESKDLTPEKVNEALNEKISSQVKDHQKVYVITDGSEVRKEHTKTSESLMKVSVKDLKSIKNIIAITYLVGAYYYEIGEGLIDEEFIELLAEMGFGKGKTGRVYLARGLEDIITMVRTLNWLKTKKIPKEKLQKLLDQIGMGDLGREVLTSVQF